MGPSGLNFIAINLKFSENVSEIVVYNLQFQIDSLQIEISTIDFLLKSLKSELLKMRICQFARHSLLFYL